MSSTNPRRRTPVTRPDSPTLRGLGLKTMGLRKGATFHTPPSSPSSSTAEAFVPPTLSRAQSNLDDVVDAHVRRAALVIGNIDQTLSLEGPSATHSVRKRNTWRDESLPVPRGFLEPPNVDPTMAKELAGAERRSLRLRQRRSSHNNHESDSGLGTSLASTIEKHVANPASKEKKASAITRSAAMSASTKQKLPGMSQRAVNRVHEHILRPLLAKPSLKEFRPIVMEVPTRIAEKDIVCLRDLEKTLIFMAPERTKTADLYLDFCLTSIRCIQATVDYLPEREQTRPAERPYSHGYFIDLVEQIRNYADQIRTAKEAESDADVMEFDRTNEVKLFGGIAENGRPAELVRIRKDGKAISMATGLPVDIDEDVKGPIHLKRSLSQQAEDEEEILRSMARRKKNASPEELAPKKCTHAGCDKEFKRPCDLTKHEKTHSRPWKCPLPTCKYHEYGWPTEKEMDRHINDKHSNAPAMYECQFKPCPYKSKRESNCKQHMEKAHGWTYVRTKTNGKKGGSLPPSSAHPTPQLGNMPTPSSNASIATPPGESVSHFLPFSTAHDNTLLDFPAYPSNEEFAFSVNHPQNSLMDLSMDIPVLEQSTPSTSSSYGPYSTYQDGAEFTMTNDDDLYAAHATIPQQMPSNFWHDGKYLAQLPQGFLPQETGLQTQALHISPIGEGNAMLYTPNSLAEVDEGFEDLPVTGVDFQLYSNACLQKEPHFDGSLFAEAPSAGMGFSQPGTQDIFQDMDWNADYAAYQQ